MRIINLTQHAATPEQLAAGVVEPADKKQVQALLTFETLESTKEVGGRAVALAALASEYDAAMIGGAPFFMSALESALEVVGVKPLYAFSVRESVESVATDGTVTKTNVFKHVGFVDASAL